MKREKNSPKAADKTAGPGELSSLLTTSRIDLREFKRRTKASAHG